LKINLLKISIISKYNACNIRPFVTMLSKPFKKFSNWKIFFYWSAGASFTKITCVFDVSFGNFLQWNTYNFVKWCIAYTVECQAWIKTADIKQKYLSKSVLFLDKTFCKNLEFFLSEWGTWSLPLNLGRDGWKAGWLACKMSVLCATYHTKRIQFSAQSIMRSCRGERMDGLSLDGDQTLVHWRRNKMY
jgi:hypothetical protein